MELHRRNDLQYAYHLQRKPHMTLDALVVFQKLYEKRLFPRQLGVRCLRVLYYSSRNFLTVAKAELTA